MGTSYTCIEQKNLAKISHVLLRSGKKLSTDFTGIDDKNLERFPRKHVRVLVHMSNHTGALRLQSQHISNLKSFLHFMVHVVDSSKKLIEDTSCLQCLTHFETFRDKQVTLSFTVREIAVVPPQEHCTAMRFRRKSITIDNNSKSTTCSKRRPRAEVSFWQGGLLWSS